jgi:hypothetical protein
MFRYVNNTSIHSYCADGSTECDGSWQLLLCAIRRAAGTATEFIISFCTRTVYISRPRVYTANWTNSNKTLPYCQQWRLRQLSWYIWHIRNPVTPTDTYITEPKCKGANCSSRNRCQIEHCLQCRIFQWYERSAGFVIGTQSASCPPFPVITSLAWTRAFRLAWAAGDPCRPITGK